MPQRLPRSPMFVLLCALVSACGAPATTDKGTQPTDSRIQPTSTRIQPSKGPLQNTVLGREYSHDLYTHCGILETRFAGQYWVTTPELDDGMGNPPAGWNNPAQRGTIRLLSPTKAQFRDRAGHVVDFALRKEATTFMRICS